MAVNLHSNLGIGDGESRIKRAEGRGVFGPTWRTCFPER